MNTARVKTCSVQHRLLLPCEHPFVDCARSIAPLRRGEQPYYSCSRPHRHDIRKRVVSHTQFTEVVNQGHLTAKDHHLLQQYRTAQKCPVVTLISLGNARAKHCTQRRNTIHVSRGCRTLTHSNAKCRTHCSRALLVRSHRVVKVHPDDKREPQMSRCQNIEGTKPRHVRTVTIVARARPAGFNSLVIYSSSGQRYKSASIMTLETRKVQCDLKSHKHTLSPHRKQNRLRLFHAECDTSFAESKPSARHTATSGILPGHNRLTRPSTSTANDSEQSIGSRHFQTDI